jgi:hypothetical protein
LQGPVSLWELWPADTFGTIHEAGGTFIPRPSSFANRYYSSGIVSAFICILSKRGFMNRASKAFVFCSILAFGGCGGTSAPSGTPLPAAQHGGNIVALSNAKGFAELMIEKGKPVKGETKTRLLAYFYQPDGTSAMTPAPSDVKVHLGAAGQGTDVKLTSQTTPTGLFASEPGQYPDELRGQIELTVGGEPVKTDFMFR